jgi:hypothetical protein
MSTATSLRQELRSIIAPDNDVPRAYEKLSKLSARIIREYVLARNSAPAIAPQVFDLVAGSDAHQLKALGMHGVEGEATYPYDTMDDAELLRYKALVKYLDEARHGGCEDVAMTGRSLRRLLNVAYAPGPENWVSVLGLMRARDRADVKKIEGRMFFVGDLDVLADSFADEKKIVAMLKVHGIKIKMLTGARVKGGDVLYAVQVSDAVDFAFVSYPRGTAVVVTHAADTTDEQRTRIRTKGVLPRDPTMKAASIERLDTLIFGGAPTIQKDCDTSSADESSSSEEEEEDNDDDVWAMAAAMVEKDAT